MPKDEWKSSREKDLARRRKKMPSYGSLPSKKKRRKKAQQAKWPEWFGK